nr:hybrid signal transduction histidine kinase M [Tanacetum cinerariifolium]
MEKAFGFLDGTTVNINNDANEWKKLDCLVKVWIYGTISTSLLQTVLKKNVTAKDVWTSLKNLFHDNKDARALELQEEVRSLDLSNLTIVEYFKKIKVTADLLSNIDADVDEKTLVMYVINGFGDRYDHVASIIRHNPKRPTLLETRSMLLLEESRMNRKQNRSHTGDNSSSPNVLVASLKADPPKKTLKKYTGTFKGATTLPRAFNTMSFRYADNNEDSGWYMDTGAISHLSTDPGKLTTLFNKSSIPSIIVGNEATIPLGLFMHDPREPYLAALKRVLRYVRGTINLGLQLYRSMTSQLISYTNADWAGSPVTRRSTFGYCVFLGDNLLSLSSKRQHTLSRSSAEAEYHGVANVVAETAWIRNLLHEI